MTLTEHSIKSSGLAKHQVSNFLMILDFTLEVFMVVGLFLYLLFESGLLKLTVCYEGYVLIVQILCKLSANRTDSEPPPIPITKSVSFPAV